MKFDICTTRFRGRRSEVACESLAEVARREHDFVRIPAERHADVYLDRCLKRCHRFRFHDSGGSENRDAALNPEARIEGALRNFPAVFAADLQIESGVPAAISLIQHLLHGLDHHAPRNGIDRRRPNGDLHAGLRHDADSLAAQKNDFASAIAFHTRKNARAVGLVGIISRVLDHIRAHRAVIFIADAIDRNREILRAIRQDNIHFAWRLVADESEQRCFHRRRRATARRVTTLQAVCSQLPQIETRWRR